MSNNKIKSEPISGNDSAKEGNAESKETTKSSTAATAAASARARAVPNLFVRRPDKDTAKTQETTETATNQKPARRPHVPNLRGRGARSSNNLIQTHSILEAGPAESTKRYGGTGDSTESYSKVVGPAEHTSNNKSQIKSESDSNYIKIENSLLIDDSKEALLNETDLKTAAFINLKFESKEKQTDSINNDELDSRLKELFIKDEQNEKLILLQMPDNLNLNEMNDGKIGKLRVYKSGRVELCLNDEKYLNVSLSVSGSFLQEAVGLELTTNEQNTQNRLTNIGQIETKLVCSPVL